MSDPKKIEPVCPECGSNAVTFECTTAKWDVAAQEVVLHSELGLTSCDECGEDFDEPEWRDVVEAAA